MSAKKLEFKSKSQKTLNAYVSDDVDDSLITECQDLINILSKTGLVAIFHHLGDGGYTQLEYNGKYIFQINESNSPLSKDSLLYLKNSLEQVIKVNNYNLEIATNYYKEIISERYKTRSIFRMILSSLGIISPFSPLVQRLMALEVINQEKLKETIDSFNTENGTNYNYISNKSYEESNLSGTEQLLKEFINEQSEVDQFIKRLSRQ